jgi:hypothetical protein
MWRRVTGCLVPDVSRLRVGLMVKRHTSEEMRTSPLIYLVALELLIFLNENCVTYMFVRACVCVYIYIYMHVDRTL